MWEQYKHLISVIDVGGGALARAAQWAAGYQRPLIVSDVNTHKAAGEALCALLDGAGARYDALIYPDDLLTADEAAAGRLLAAYAPHNDVVLGVGSGTISDLCKFLCFRAGRPCAAIGTAPSMDGYASAGAAMTIDGVKVTPRTQCPEAIFCDVDIMKNAPMPMLAAGLGDVLGKLSALADWRLSHLLTGEPMPGDIAALVSDAVKRCMDNAGGLAARRADAVKSVAEALILSGIAMSLYGDSRPASGTEHHISHFWEMRFIAEGKPPVLHGLKVGVATLLALDMWKTLPAAPPRPDAGAMAYRGGEALRRAYGAAAAALSGENPILPFERVLENWDGVMEIARAVPAPETAAGPMRTLGAPLTPGGIGVGPELLADGILFARERKKTYTLLQLLGGLGLLEQAAARCVKNGGAVLCF
ncbi:MAG: sn-glycerol-1-phosphate dehydrogenase [Oscillospiraceae bacterium]|nr:sn-glycerol-1-phosphate dehydrogenase [Oscillospiraceae bacterium]